MIGDPRDAGFLRDDSQDCQASSAQNACDRMELIIVTSAPDALGMDEADMSRFLTYRSSVDRTRSIASVNPAGARRAQAPGVALAEDHAFPAPGWA